MAKKPIPVQEQRRLLVENMRYLHHVFTSYDKQWVMGIDPSLNHTAVAVQKIRKKRVKVSSSPATIRDSKQKKTATHRIALTRHFLINQVQKYPPLLIAVEGYAYGRAMNRELLGEVGGMIRLNVFWDHPDEVGPVLIVGATQLKKFILGSGTVGGGKKTKQLIIMNVFKKWGIEVADDNEADAIVLVRMAKEFVKFVLKLHDKIPSDEKGLRNFVNNGWEEYGYKKYIWEIFCSFVINKGNNQLFDFCSEGKL